MTEKNINILSIVSYKVYPAKMGGQKGIAFFYDYFSSLLPLTIVTTKNNEDLANSNISLMKLLSNGKRKYANPLLIFMLKSIIAKRNITHVIIEHPYYGWLAYFLKKLTKVKLIVHSHNIEGLRFKSTNKWWWKLLMRYEKFTHRIADYIFFINDADKMYAIENFSLDVNKCTTITYGFELQSCPTNEEKHRAKLTLMKAHDITADTMFFLFNGTLDYAPNRQALDVILSQINPVLLAYKNLTYKIIICGKNLPASYNELESYSDKNVIYAGFVDDINLYFKACDIFINPVIEGGGIKTKLVEALGFGLDVVTTTDGAVGVPPQICNDKMVIVDNDWQAFAAAIYALTQRSFKKTPPAYYQYFYWGNIVQKAKEAIESL